MRWEDWEMYGLPCRKRILRIQKTAHTRMNMEKGALSSEIQSRKAHLKHQNGAEEAVRIRAGGAQSAIQSENLRWREVLELLNAKTK
jgi:hypothetical protein